MAEQVMTDKRPKNRELTSIRLSLSAWLSIFQQISGLTLFLLLPAVLWIFQASLASHESFAAIREYFAQPWARLTLIGALWLFMHHLCVAVRSLLIDWLGGVGLYGARLSSRLAVAAGMALSLLAGGLLPW